MNSWRKASRRTYALIAGAILIVLIGVIAFVALRSQGSGAVFKKVRVERGDLSVTILSTGIVQPENRLAIKPPIAGRVEEVLVDEGVSVKKGQVLVLMSSTERAALLDAARARGNDEYERWKSFYRPTPIMAPIDGTIILRSVEPGQSFTTAEAVLTMSDRLTVKAQVDETDIARIQLQQPAEVILDAYPDDIIPAKVDKIAYDATTVNNVTTYIADVLPENTPPFMRSGMTANVRFAVESKQGVLLLPSNAVKNKEDHHFVLVPAPRALGAPVEQEVQTGATNGKLVEILSGIAEGDEVLVQQPKNGKEKTGSNPFSPFGAPRTR